MKNSNNETFIDWSDAFDTCRERNRPINATVDGETCKIYPSGRSVNLKTGVVNGN